MGYRGRGRKIRNHAREGVGDSYWYKNAINDFMNDIKHEKAYSTSYGLKVHWESPTRLVYNGNPILVKDEAGQIFITNKITHLGGVSNDIPRTYSDAIEMVWRELVTKGIDYKVVNGWASLNNEVVDPPPTHKTVGGLIRSFGKYTTDQLNEKYCWCGTPPEYIIETPLNLLWRAKRPISYLKKVDGNLTMAARYHNIYKCEDKDTYMCDVCPAKFQCLTQTETYKGEIFYINVDAFVDLEIFKLYPAMKNSLPCSVLQSFSKLGDLSLTVAEREATAEGTDE